MLIHFKCTNILPLSYLFSYYLLPVSWSDHFPHVISYWLFSTEVLSPAVVTLSESGPTSIRVSWGPSQPDQITSYYIEYSALPRGKLHAFTVGRTQNSTLLRDLQPDTTYLVTVSARHTSGTEKAMSVKVCTPEGELHEDDQYLNFNKYIYLSTVLKYTLFMQLYTSAPLHFRSK